MSTAVVITVLNEANSLPRLLDSLAAQTQPPDEVVICDGGSTDGTLEILRAEERLPLRIIHRAGANISAGRNAAIRAAAGPVIAVTDAGVRLSPTWLEALTAPFADAKIQVVSGFFRPDPHTVFEYAMGATVLPEQREIDPAHFLPSSRSIAFRKEAWRAVGGYPEWLDYCEDLIFDFRLRALYGPFPFVPQALVHFRPRPTLHAFFRQYYHYARGDGKANLWPLRHAIRYATYLGAIPLIALAGALLHPAWWALYLAAIPAFFGRGWLRLTHMWRPLSTAQRLQTAAWVPIIRLTGDVAKMVGYPVGLRWRWAHRSQIPNWRAT
jgi:glycosyltransferase involved in cell wall biosynthesis